MGKKTSVVDISTYLIYLNAFEIIIVKNTEKHRETERLFAKLPSNITKYCAHPDAAAFLANCQFLSRHSLVESFDAVDHGFYNVVHDGRRDFLHDVTPVGIQEVFYWSS